MRFKSKLYQDFTLLNTFNEQLGAANEIVKQHQYYAINQGQYNTNGYNGHIFASIDKEDSCNGSKTQSSATTTESNTPENTVRIDNEMNARSSFKANHSNNVTFLANGELVTECKQ